ncbi:DUF6708 domain-containing protein [Achromobacter mucicolens]|uniref:DUF6708 domain-containing protein n=1 Tax=Achromobacter mucicolens TaxID=1389922 RepID=UPI001F0C6D10|nr:DUF6708 domain-containing protein [Achromobacter mucicolens]
MMTQDKSVLDRPTKGWKADLPLPQTTPEEKLQAIGLPPNYVGDVHLELHVSRVVNRTVVILCALIMFLGALFLSKILIFEFADISGYPFVFLLLFGLMVLGVLAGVTMYRAGVAPPRDEPIRFNRFRGKVYVYRFCTGGPLSRKGWGVRPVVFNWEDLRAEGWSRMGPSPSGVPVFAWGVDVAVVAPGTNHVIDRFQLAGSNANGEHLWAMARAFMNQGPEALPKYPHPPRDWNNDVPAFDPGLRLAPKVQWPVDMDRESRTAL